MPTVMRRAMVRHVRLLAGATCTMAVVGCTIAGAQSNIERRIAAAGDGPVQFTFAAREGVCGNGRSFFRMEDEGWYQSSSSSGSIVGDGPRSDVCARGPVRVVLTRAGRELVKVETYAGPLAQDAEAGRDLGPFAAREAAQYLLQLAATTDGRPAREAITPAMLADSATVTAPLLAIVRDKARSRDVRRSALSWAARRRAESGNAGAATVVRALESMVRDREESESMRQQALSTLSSLNRGEGIPMLIGFAADGDEWVATQALRSLSRSGDPRARDFTREAVRRSTLPDDVRAEMIRGLGGDFAVASDYKLIRDLYPTLNADRDRDAVISTLANAGGRENADWLIGVAKSQTESVARRRRVISALGKLEDPRVKEALKDLIVR